MTNSKKLKSLLILNGLSQKKIADYLQISIQSVNYKINNKRRFTTLEIVKMCKILHLQNNEDICKIFFNLDVD